MQKTFEKVKQLTDSIHETAQKMPPKQESANKDTDLELTRKDKAVDPIKVLPLRRIRSRAKPQKKWEKERAYDNEYVVGILENKVSPTEGAHFWKNNFPGDDYCEWQIPPNIAVAIPRHVANHLHEKIKYHTFKYKETPPANQIVDQFKEKFDYDQTYDRMTFSPLRAF